MKRKLISLLALVLLLTAVLASCGTFNFEKKNMQKYLKDFTVDKVNNIKVEATLPDRKTIVDDAVEAEIAATLLKNKFIADDLKDKDGWTADATLEKGDGAKMYYIAVKANGSKDYNFYYERGKNDEKGKFVLPQIEEEKKDDAKAGESSSSSSSSSSSTATSTKKPTSFILGENKFSANLEAELIKNPVKPGDTYFVDVSENNEEPVRITSAHTIYVTYSAVYKNTAEGEEKKNYAATTTSRLNLASKEDFTDMDDDLETYLRGAMAENSEIVIMEGTEYSVDLKIKPKKDSDETVEITFTYKVEYVTEEKTVTYTVDEKKSATSTATEKVTYYCIIAQVQDYTVPELNEDTVKNILKFKTDKTGEAAVTAYRESVAVPYIEKYEAAKKSNANNALWNALVASVEVKKYPKSYVNGYVDEVINNAKYYYYNAGYSVTTSSGSNVSYTPEQLQAQYPEFIAFLRVMLGNKTAAQMPDMKAAKEYLKTEAQAKAKSLMLLYGLADLVGVTVDRKTDAEYLKLCKDGGVNSYYTNAQQFEQLGLTDYADSFYQMAAELEEAYYEQLIYERSLGKFYETKNKNGTLTFKEATSKK